MAQEFFQNTNIIIKSPWPWQFISQATDQLHIYLEQSGDHTPVAEMQFIKKVTEGLWRLTC